MTRLAPLRLRMPARAVDGKYRGTAGSSDDRSLADHLAYLAWLTPQHEENPETIDLVRDCMARLHTKDSDLLQARFYEGLSYRQIAVRFGWAGAQSAHWAVQKAVGRLGRKVKGALYARSQREEAADAAQAEA